MGVIDLRSKHENRREVLKLYPPLKSISHICFIFQLQGADSCPAVVLF